MVFVVDSDPRRRETEMLARLARLLTATLDVENVGGQLADVLLSLFGVQSSSLRLLAPDRSVVVLACAGRSRGYFDPGYVTPPGQGVVGRAVGAGQPVQTADLLGES